MCSDGHVWLNAIATLELARIEKRTADNGCTGCNLRMPRRHKVVNEQSLVEDNRNREDLRTSPERLALRNKGKHRCSECGEVGHDRRRHKVARVTQAA